MEDINLYFELLKDSPLAVLVGFTIWQLSRLNTKLDTYIDLLKRSSHDQNDGS